jgi:hypothetical protein
MESIPWEITHSVETNASPDFAWNYWTDVKNWDDPPAKFELEGPFASGSRGITQLPGQPPLRWFIREVHPPHGATIEMQLEGATVSFQWRLLALADGRTRLTQRIVLEGEKADMYLSQLKDAFTSNLPAGMDRLAAAMASNDPHGKDSGPV